MMNFKMVGHRGAGANGPFPIRPIQIMENTLPSFIEAAKLGAHMIEFGKFLLGVQVFILERCAVDQG